MHKHAKMVLILAHIYYFILTFLAFEMYFCLMELKKFKIFRMQRCNSEFIFSISLTVILLNLYNANAIVSRKLLHKNGVKGIHKLLQI